MQGSTREITADDDMESPEHIPAGENDVGITKRRPPWTQHITVRGLVASLMIGIMYSVIVMKLNLTTGLVPNLNVSAALLAFVFIKTWTRLLHKAGFTTTPFNRQENTIIQTCAVACYSISVGGNLLILFYSTVFSFKFYLEEENVFCTTTCRKSLLDEKYTVLLRCDSLPYLFSIMTVILLYVLLNELLDFCDGNFVKR